MVGKLSTFYFLLLLPAFTLGQISLQVEFERGFPIPEKNDEVKSFSSSSSSKASGLTGVGPLDDQSKEWRLPRDVIPTEYYLRLTPILDEEVEGLGSAFTAPGHVKILVTVQSNQTNSITLHVASEYFIRTGNWTVVNVNTGLAIPIVNTTDNELHQFRTLHLGETLVLGGQYEIDVDFVANIVPDLNGLYRSSYRDPYSNTTKWIATTQMEALHARQMFPCFDEPAFKAIFHISIGRRRDHIALTTTQLWRSQTIPGFPDWTMDEFAPTVRMPTYLLAVIISQFTYEDAHEGIYPNKQVRTYAPPHYIDMNGGVYAAEKAAQLLTYFESYYRERYELYKMDSAAVPDFFFGAMENYGLNIYRETALLYFPHESNEDERFRITRILAHELGHQWYGNLVSPAWWTHIWLNEGFATYVAAQGANAVAPEFQAWERFQNDAVQNAMGFDARSDYSHSVKIDEQAWIENGAMSWFDRMAYEKAGSLILMMNGFLGEDTFQRGLREYLTAKRYDNAVQDDLFEHLNVFAKNESKIPADLTMKDIMDTWTLQPGFPLIRVSVADAGNVFVSQERFLNNQPQTPNNHIRQNSDLWTVPMMIATRTNPTGRMDWLYSSTAVKTIATNSSDYIVVNAFANGFYRVLYDTQLTQLIKRELDTDHTFISSRTRSQLLDDYFTSAWQRHISIASALSLTTYLGREQEIVVWNSVLNNLRRPFNLFSSANGAHYTALRSYLLPRLQGAISLTGGIENANLPEQFGGMPVLRHLQFLDWLCAFEDTECQAFALRQINMWIAVPGFNRIRRDIKPVVYCSAVAIGSDSVLNFVHQRYRLTTNTLKEQGMLLNALACTKDIAQINFLLERTVAADSASFFNQTSHATVLMSQLARNPLARGPLVRFLRQPGVAQALAGSIPSVITSLATYVSTPAELGDIQTFITENPQFEESTRTAINTIQGNIQWVEEYGPQMTEFFTSVTA